MKDLTRSVSMRCPVCGNDQFSAIDESVVDFNEAPFDTLIKCSDCKSIYTKKELVEENHEVITANIEEIKKEAIKEFKKLFKSKR